MDGQPGQSAPVPLLKTGQQLIADALGGTWTADAVYLSVDNGKTWKQVSGEDGTDGRNGDSMFISIDYLTDEDFVTFTLASGGGVIQVPKYKGASLTLSSPDGPWKIGYSVSLDYKITYGNSSRRQIEIIAPKGWKAEIDESRHQLIITAPQMVDLSTADYEGKLIMMLNIDNDPSIIRTVDVKLMDQFHFSLGGGIANLLNHYGYKGKTLTVTGGTISKADCEALKNNTTIQMLDLSGMMSDLNEKKEYYSLPVNAFHSNTTLQTVKLPQALEVIGDSAFCRCSSLQVIEIPTKVKAIPPRAFYKCSSLRKVILPEGLDSIKGGENIKLDPNGPSAKWWGAFQECRTLTEINIPSSCKWIGYGTFFMSGIIASDPKQHNGELTIGKGVKIGDCCFRRSKITKLTLYSNDTIPSSNKLVPPMQIFMECQDLKEVVFGDLLTHSPGDKEDFRGCKTLETVTLGSHFTTIHVGMFVECENLKSVIWPFYPTDVKRLRIEKGEVTITGEKPFKDASPFFRASDDFKIYVPDGAVDDMKREFSFLEEHFAPMSSKP